MSFRDRYDAGRRLASRLRGYAGRGDVVVLGLPRGGVPVAYEVALALEAPLDVFVVRKLGLPGHEELAFGAIASGGVRVVNDRVLAGLSIPPEMLEQVAAREERELARREAAYRDGHTPVELLDRTAVLVDDGLATGASMRAAVLALRQRAPSHVVVAVPVGAPAACRELEGLVDAVVCALAPPSFSAVGEWYEDFSQTSDDEVRRLLALARARNEAGVAASPGRTEGPWPAH